MHTYAIQIQDGILDYDCGIHSTTSDENIQDHSLIPLYTCFCCFCVNFVVIVSESGFYWLVTLWPVVAHSWSAERQFGEVRTCCCWHHGRHRHKKMSRWSALKRKTNTFCRLITNWLRSRYAQTRAPDERPLEVGERTQEWLRDQRLWIYRWFCCEWSRGRDRWPTR